MKNYLLDCEISISITVFKFFLKEKKKVRQQFVSDLDVFACLFYVGDIQGSFESAFKMIENAFDGNIFGTNP